MFQSLLWWMIEADLVVLADPTYNGMFQSLLWWMIEADPNDGKKDYRFKVVSILVVVDD